MLEVSYTIQNIQEIAKKILANISNKTICFYGDMGAGKTTLVKAIVKELGCQDISNSPTYGIVNEYADENGELLAYHFDFYRLNNETEALDLGVEDYFNQGVFVFIEWPEMINSYLPEECTNIYLKVEDVKIRRLTIKE